MRGQVSTEHVSTRQAKVGKIFQIVFFWEFSKKKLIIIFRCITDIECRNLNNARNTSLEARTQNYVPFNGHCHLGCPQGFVEKKVNGVLMCDTCDGTCLKHCPAKSIDSIAAAQSLAGCAIIDGSLEIQIRSQGEFSFLKKSWIFFQHFYNF